jgi:putative membrane protein
MKLTGAGIAIVAMIAGSAFAQTNGRPTADPLAVKPIPPQAQTVDSDTIRTKIEGAGYTEVTDLSRDGMGVWRARAKKGDESIDIVVDKGGRIKSERR